MLGNWVILPYIVGKNIEDDYHLKKDLKINILKEKNIILGAKISN